MKKEENAVHYQENRDVNGKTIFHDPLLCSQFLRDYVDIPMLKNVRPEDIEDVSERYRTFMGVEFEADTVKKIKCPGVAETEDNKAADDDTSLYIVSLIEHKSRVDYDVALQLLKYILGIWIDYRNEQNRKKEGVSSRKTFRYPPVIPIVYYEGAAKWTAELKMSDRVTMKESFGAYIPDFTYKVVSIHDYSNAELLSKEDEMSLIMMLNKIQTAEDLTGLLKMLKEQLEKIQSIIAKTPESIVKIISGITYNLCRRLNLPEDETRQYIRNVEGRDMGYLFENMEKMDIQAERRNTAEAREEARQAKEELRQAKEEARRRKEEVQKDIEKEKEEGVRLFIEGYQEVGITREMTSQKLQEKFGLSEEAALEKVALYWKTGTE